MAIAISVIHEPRQEIGATGRWFVARAFDVEIASQEHLHRCIAKKNIRCSAYRQSANDVWRMVINDQFLGAGEVYVRPEDLARWRFPFDFDKVMLFSRKVGGGGTVVELQRA